MEANLDFLEKIVNIVESSSSIAMDVYNKDSKDFGTDLKEDDSPVTFADKLCAEFINKELYKINHQIPIINEETKNMEYKERKNYKYAWIVDPIDGTKEFIKKTGEFTVNIGLVQNGKVVLGVVSIPCKKIIYYGSTLLGAFKKNYETGKIKKIKANNWNPHKQNIQIATSKSHLNKETTDYIDLWKFNNPQMFATGSSLKILYVAEGVVDFYPRLGPTMEWDTCAAHGVLKSAGGNLRTIKNQEVTYNKENLYNPFFICYGS